MLALVLLRGQGRGTFVRIVPRVVQISQHRRVLRGGLEHLPEIAQHIGPNGVAFVAGNEVRRLVDPRQTDIKVVEPEVRQHLYQLVVATDRPLGFQRHLLVQQVHEVAIILIIQNFLQLRHAVEQRPVFTADIERVGDQ